MNVTISTQGHKAQVLEEVNSQVENPQLKTALHSLITALPGSHLNIVVSINAGEQTHYGNFEVKGSCWTPKSQVG